MLAVDPQSTVSLCICLKVCSPIVNDSCRVCSDMVLVKLLGLFPKEIFEQLRSLPGYALKVLYGTSIMSSIGESIAAFGPQKDIAVLHGCFVAASSMLPDIQLGSAQLDTLTKACQVLFLAGRRLSFANKLLLDIGTLLGRHGVEPTLTLRRMMAASRARGGKTNIKNVQLVAISEPAGMDLDTGAYREPNHDIGFTNLITDIVPVEGVSSSSQRGPVC
jgi:hypothetical protein